MRPAGLYAEPMTRGSGWCLSDTSEALEDEDHVPTTEQDYPEDLTQIIARFVQRVLDPEMIVIKVTVARFVQRVLDPKMIAIAMQADAGERPALLSHLVSHWYDGIDFRYPPDRYPCSLWSELLRPAICVAQFEHAAEQLYPEMFKYFGGIDAFIWKARQHAPAFYNENGTATYHVNQDHMATCMKDLDNAFLVCTDVTPIVGPTFWYDRAGFRRLLWCCGCEEPDREPNFHVRERTFAYWGPDARPVRWARDAGERRRLRAMVYFLVQRRGALAYVAWGNPWCLVGNPDDLATFLRLPAGAEPMDDQPPTLRAHLVWRLLVRRWATRAVDDFVAARGLTRLERDYEQRVLEMPNPPTLYSRHPRIHSREMPTPWRRHCPHPMLYDEAELLVLTPRQRNLVVSRERSLHHSRVNGDFADARRVLRDASHGGYDGRTFPSSDAFSQAGMLLYTCDDARVYCADARVHRHWSPASSQDDDDDDFHHDGDSAGMESDYLAGGSHEWDGRFGEF